MFLNWQSSQQALARDYQADAVAILERQGLEVAFETELSRWYTDFHGSHGDVYFTPSFDPENVDVRPSDFCGALLRCAGEIVARSGIRLVETDDLVRDELVTMRIWRNRPCLEERLAHLARTNVPKIKGRTCHEGSTWVAPAFRRRGIAARLVNALRAIALAQWKPGWIFGFVQPDVFKSGVAHRTYGYRLAAPLEIGYLPVVRRYVSVYLSYMSSQEAALRLRSQGTSRAETRTPGP